MRHDDILRPTVGKLARRLTVDNRVIRLSGIVERVGDILHIEYRPGRLARLLGRRRYAELVIVDEVDLERGYVRRGYAGSWVRSFPKGATVTIIGSEAP